MIDWPIGLSTGCFYQSNILTCLEPVRQAGFSLLEICSSPSHLDYHDPRHIQETREALRDLRLEAYSMHAPWAETIDISSPDPFLRKRGMDEMGQAVKAAQSLGVRYFVIHPGPERDNLPAHELASRMQYTASMLEQLAELCEKSGLLLVLENKLPHLFAGHVRDLLWMLGSLRSTRVGICLDTGHAYLSGELSRIVQKLSGHLWMVHASDNQGVHDDHLPPGRGSLDWAAVFRQLAGARFGGALVLELAGGQPIRPTLDGAMEGRSYLRQLQHSLR